MNYGFWYMEMGFKKGWKYEDIFSPEKMQP